MISIRFEGIEEGSPPLESHLEVGSVAVVVELDLREPTVHQKRCFGEIEVVVLLVGAAMDALE